MSKKMFFPWPILFLKATDIEHQMVSTKVFEFEKSPKKEFLFKSKIYFSTRKINWQTTWLKFYFAKKMTFWQPLEIGSDNQIVSLSLKD